MSGTRDAIRAPGELLAASRQHRFTRFMMTCVGAWAVFALFHALLGRWRTSVLDLGVLAVSALILWISRHELRAIRIRAYTHATIAASTIGLVIAALLSGQGDSMAIWYLVAVPLFAAFLIDTRAAVVWTFLVLVAFVAIHASHEVFPIAPEFVPRGWELWFGRATLAVVVLTFGVAWRSSTERYVAALRSREALIGEQAEAAQRQSVELALARDTALAAAAAKSRFLANMSHEIRTPLSGVIGMTDLLLSEPLPPDGRQHARTIRTSGQMVLKVVDDILELSRLQSSDVSLESVAFDPKACVRDVVSITNAAVVEKGLDLDVELGDPELGWVLGDEARLRQVLLNLVSNAIKFTNHGRINVRAGQAGPDRIYLEVEDTGIGVPLSVRDSIFDAFAQADSSTSRRFGGTGLGLAISKRLVMRMGGTIVLRSEEGKGSSFRVTLPLPSTERPRRSRAETLDDAPQMVLGMRVLLAEDDPVNRQVALQMLRRLGVDVEVAKHGRAAYEATIAGDYDLVLLDMQMPEMDGVEVIRRVRKEMASRAPRIVAVTANVLAEQRAQLEAVGIDAFLPKPLRFDALRAVLARSPEPIAPLEAPDPTAALDRLRVLSGSDERFMTMIDDHLQNTARLCDAILQAHRVGDRESLERTAHSLKSTSAMFGSLRLSELSAGIEAQAAEGIDAVSPSELVGLQREASRARERLLSSFGAPMQRGGASR